MLLAISAIKAATTPQAVADLPEVVCTQGVTKDSQPVPIYAIVPQSVQELDLCKPVLGDLAQKGLIVHIDSALFKALQVDLGKNGARAYAKPFTAHNDKMCADWSIPGRRYKIESGPQFSVSAYKNFVTTASKFLQGKVVKQNEVEYDMSAYARILSDSANFYTRDTVTNP